MRRRYTVWTELLDEYIIAKRRQGERLRIVASAIGCSPNAVRNRYMRLCRWSGIDGSNWRKKRRTA